VFLYYIMHVLKLLYVLKSHKNPLGRFIILSIHRDRPGKATLFYTYIMIMIYATSLQKSLPNDQLDNE
jgi:uncharacterized membrane protein YwaF